MDHDDGKNGEEPQEHELTLAQLRQFEISLGLEKRSLVYAYMASTNTPPDQLEIVREHLSRGPNNQDVSFYVQKRGTSRTVETREAELARANKILRRTIPKLLAQKRHTEAKRALTGGQEWVDACEYMEELIKDTYEHLGIKEFVKGESNESDN